MPTMITTIFTVRPFAAVAADDAGDLLDAVGAALERDTRVLGPVGYDYETGRIDAIFQVDSGDDSDPRHEAVAIALSAFDHALKQAGSGAHTAGWSIVEGDDPDQLP